MLLTALHRCTIIVDSGCGTGRSTRILAEANPHAAVLGVDRSEHRLARGFGARSGKKRLPLNARLVRAELSGFWRLLLSRGLAPRVTQHTLLYPNPYPKAGQLGRRWATHPAFPVLCQLGGTLEVRSNWYAYLIEFTTALQTLATEPSVPADLRLAASGHLPYELSTVPFADEEHGITQFEIKYMKMHQGLYRLRTNSDSSWRHLAHT